jgi:tetratricopeptide (TPR) repeat protein
MLDLRRPGKVPADIAQVALDVLARSPADAGRCAPRALAARKLLLGEVLKAANAPEPVVQEGVIQGLAALEAGDPEKAFELCDPVSAANPKGPAALCAGRAAEALGRWPDAVRNLRAHLALHPADEDAVLLLAKCVGRAGDDEAARALLRRYVAAHPDHLRARTNLGVAHARLHEYQAARAAWNEVLRRSPENADALELLSHLPK